MYEKMYTTLFNAITDATHQIETLEIREALHTLKEAQCATEEQYLSGEIPEESAPLLDNLAAR